MGTRAGSFDPDIILQLLRDGRMTLEELAEALDHGSGLRIDAREDLSSPLPPGSSCAPPLAPDRRAFTEPSGLCASRPGSGRRCCR
jgi:hypothetical protein